MRDQQQKVYVQCRQCENLMARYILQTGVYYHAGKDLESFLRSIERDGDLWTGRDLQGVFDEVKADVNTEFTEVQTLIQERYKNGIP